MLHRRINILIYLNKEWDPSGRGGSIELHSDPSDPRANRVQGFVPLFNRAVIFETGDSRGMASPTIVLPPDKRHLSRKSFSIYLYTKDRPGRGRSLHRTPAASTSGSRFPDHIKAGRTRVSEVDVKGIGNRLVDRDGLLRMYQKLLIEKEQRLRDFVHTHQSVGRCAAVQSLRSSRLRLHGAAPVQVPAVSSFNQVAGVTTRFEADAGLARTTVRSVELLATARCGSAR